MSSVMDELSESPVSHAVCLPHSIAQNAIEWGTLELYGPPAPSCGGNSLRSSWFCQRARGPSTAFGFRLTSLRMTIREGYQLAGIELEMDGARGERAEGDLSLVLKPRWNPTLAQKARKDGAPGVETIG